MLHVYNYSGCVSIKFYKTIFLEALFKYSYDKKYLGPKLPMILMLREKHFNKLHHQNLITKVGNICQRRSSLMSLSGLRVP